MLLERFQRCHCRPTVQPQPPNRPRRNASWPARAAHAGFAPSTELESLSTAQNLIAWQRRLCAPIGQSRTRQDHTASNACLEFPVAGTLVQCGARRVRYAFHTAKNMLGRQTDRQSDRQAEINSLAPRRHRRNSPATAIRRLEIAVSGALILFLDTLSALPLAQMSMRLDTPPRLNTRNETAIDRDDKCHRSHFKLRCGGETPTPALAGRVRGAWSCAGEETGSSVGPSPRWWYSVLLFLYATLLQALQGPETAEEALRCPDQRIGRHLHRIGLLCLLPFLLPRRRVFNTTRVAWHTRRTRPSQEKMRQATRHDA